MFPSPIQKAAPSRQVAYKIALPVALIVWLLPLLAIFLTSIRPGSDIAKGNVFGWPSSFELISNYSAVFEQSPAIGYMINSLLISIPTMIISVGMACLTGYALAVYKFKWAVPLFFVFVAGNFVPFQILMVPVIDLSNQINVNNTPYGLILFHSAFQLGFCTLFMPNFMKALPYELI